MTRNAIPPFVVYDGTSSVAMFSVAISGEPILFQENSDIVVKQKNATGGVALLVEDVDYTLTGGPDKGIVTLVAGNLPTSYKLLIIRATAISQETDFELGPDWNGARDTATASLDRIIDIVQEIDARSVRGDPFADAPLTLPPAVAGAYLVYDGAGNLATQEVIVYNPADNNATSILLGVSASIARKAACRVATTGPITLSGLQAIDGVTLASTDYNLRVLVKDQVDQTQNGFWDAQGGAWTRSKDFDGPGDVAQGTSVYVIAGATYARNFFIVTTADPVIPGTSAITFEVDRSSAAIAAAAAAAIDAANAEAAAITAVAAAATVVSSVIAFVTAAAGCGRI